MNLNSKLLEDAVEQFSSLPGIGKKTALRLVLHLLKRSPSEVAAFSGAFTQLKENLKFCTSCHNISDTEICFVCSNPHRDSSVVCIVEDIRDLMAIENTQQYKGVYHILGGVISPMNGIGPNDLNIDSLVKKCTEGIIKEVVLALSTTMEGDTTSFYLYRKLQDIKLTLSMIARGIAIGDELEYADEVTLGRSIVNRTPYETSFAK